MKNQPRAELSDYLLKNNVLKNLKLTLRSLVNSWVSLLLCELLNNGQLAGFLKIKVKHRGLRLRYRAVSLVVLAEDILYVHGSLALHSLDLNRLGPVRLVGCFEIVPLVHSRGVEVGGWLEAHWVWESSWISASLVPTDYLLDLLSHVWRYLCSFFNPESLSLFERGCRVRRHEQTEARVHSRPLLLPTFFGNLAVRLLKIIYGPLQVALSVFLIICYSCLGQCTCFKTNVTFPNPWALHSFPTFYFRSLLVRQQGNLKVASLLDEHSSPCVVSLKCALELDRVSWILVQLLSVIEQGWLRPTARLFNIYRSTSLGSPLALLLFIF